MSRGLITTPGFVLVLLVVIVSDDTPDPQRAEVWRDWLAERETAPHDGGAEGR